jgi:hypothetical protein
VQQQTTSATTNTPQHLETLHYPLSWQHNSQIQQFHYYTIIADDHDNKLAKKDT